MTQTIQTIDSARDTTLAKTALFDYALHIACLVFSLGTLVILPVIINYVQRPRSAGTIYHSHFTWQIRTFWWSLFWTVVLLVPVFLTFGVLYPLLLIPAAWYLYRMIKGIIWLNDGKAMPI